MCLFSTDIYGQVGCDFSQQAIYSVSAGDEDKGILGLVLLTIVVIWLFFLTGLLKHTLDRAYNQLNQEDKIKPRDKAKRSKKSRKK